MINQILMTFTILCINTPWKFIERTLVLFRCAPYQFFFECKTRFNRTRSGDKYRQVDVLRSIRYEIRSPEHTVVSGIGYTSTFILDDSRARIQHG